MQNYSINSNRRQFLSASAAAAGSLILGVNVSQADDAPGVSEHLDEVLALVNVPVEGATPLEKQESLLAHFRNRNVVSVYELKTDRKSADAAATTKVSTPSDLAARSSASTRKTAQQALEHVFPGQPSYDPVFRGKDEIDWDTNPHKDMEWIWQFHRFYWQQSLAIEYVRTGDEKFAQEWAFEMRSWIAHMHKPENAFKHPGWRSLDTASRMAAWSTTLEFFLKSPSLDSRLMVDIIYSMDVHCQRIKACCLAAQNRASLGNWDIYHVEGLLFTAAALPERKSSAEELVTAAKLMASFQSKVLLSDGVINEYISSYHKAYPTQFARLVRICRQLELPVEFPPEFMDNLEKSINAVVVWSHPDGTSPVFGDAWPGEKDSNRTWIKPFLPLFDRPDWRYFASKGKEGAPPDSRFQELPAAGYYTLRSDWSTDARFIVVKNSNTTRFGHNQADNLSFELSAFGERLMSDSGCYNYSGEPTWRQFFRSPMVHQLVSLDNKPIRSRGQKLSQKSVPNADGSPGIDSLTLANEPVDGLRHERTFTLVDGRFFVILDVLSGTASGELRQHFQLMPGEWRWNPETFTATTLHDGHANLILVEAKQPGVSYAEEEGWISNRYMEKERRPAFAFVQKKDADAAVCYATALIPVAPGESPEDVETSISLAPDRQIEVKIGKETWTI